jgi:hypothetical protein
MNPVAVGQPQHRRDRLSAHPQMTGEGVFGRELGRGADPEVVALDEYGSAPAGFPLVHAAAAQRCGFRQLSANRKMLTDAFWVRQTSILIRLSVAALNWVFGVKNNDIIMRANRDGCAAVPVPDALGILQNVELGR